MTFDSFDSAFLNANTVVMARSGAGKSFSTKLGLLRGITSGIVYYVIDPEGEYSSIAEAAGGRVLTPGVPGHGLNPFVLEQGDEGEVLQRVAGLRRLVEVMVGERLSPEQRATLDQALTAYYTGARTVTGFHDFFAFLDSDQRDAAAPTVNARSRGRDTSEVESDLLRWLAVMPFLSHRELETLAEWSDTAVYDALSTLERGRLVAGVQLSVQGASTTRRWFLAPSGVEAVAAISRVGLQKTLRTRPVSSHWIRLLAERMDTVTPICPLSGPLPSPWG